MGACSVRRHACYRRLPCASPPAPHRLPAVIDPSLAPAGKHTLHAYVPATEPYELWAGLDRRSQEYGRLKEERSRVLWDGAPAAPPAPAPTAASRWRCPHTAALEPQACIPGTAGGAARVLPRGARPPATVAPACRAAVRKVIPDIDSRVEVSLVGTPLTHERFLRRHRGAYGPAIRAGEALFPWHATPLAGLYCCGDFTFPGEECVVGRCPGRAGRAGECHSMCSMRIEHSWAPCGLCTSRQTRVSPGNLAV